MAAASQDAALPSEATPSKAFQVRKPASKSWGSQGGKITPKTRQGVTAARQDTNPDRIPLPLKLSAATRGLRVPLRQAVAKGFPVPRPESSRPFPLVCTQC